MSKDAKEAVEWLDKGVQAYKLPRWGAPKLSTFYLKPVNPPGTFALKWDSSKKKEDDAMLVLARDKVKLCEGQSVGLFYKAKNQKLFADKEDLSFSLIAPKRTLDIVAQNAGDYKKFMAALKKIVETTN